MSSLTPSVRAKPTTVTIHVRHLPLTAQEMSNLIDEVMHRRTR